MGSHQYLNNLLEIRRMIGLLYRNEAYALISITAPMCDRSIVVSLHTCDEDTACAYEIGTES